jgi:hypothetical protein
MLRHRIAAIANRRILFSSLPFGLTFPAIGFLLQIVVKGFFLGFGSPPTPELIVGGVILFFLTGLLFSFGFHLFRPYWPGKGTPSKAFWYSLLIGLGIYFGNIVNFMAFDPAGGADPFSAYKITHVLTAVCDLSNFLINGLLLGWLAARMKSTDDPSLSPRKLIGWPSLAGIFIFPIIGILAWTIWTPVFEVGYLVPISQALWFQAAFWIPLALACGVAVPLMYQVAEPLLSGSWLRKAGVFTILHFFLYWVTLTIFIVPLGGMTWRDVFFFFALALPVLFSASLPAAWVLAKKHSH